MLIDDQSLGQHPWDKLPPLVLDMSAAAELGYVPVGTYAETVPRELDWLVSHAPSDDYFDSSTFDYAAEDRYLAAGGDLTRGEATASDYPGQ